jgi:hypothetical protein
MGMQDRREQLINILKPMLSVFLDPPLPIDYRISDNYKELKNKSL